MYLYHFYDKRTGPFRSLTAVEPDKAEKIMETIRTSFPNSLCACRDAEYVERRRNCERIIRQAFQEKGGVIKKDSPHYMVVEFSPWLSTWYEESTYLKVPIENLDIRSICFTYGDSMPTFSDRVNDGKEYRKTVYTYEEILNIIEKYGLPQDWNDDGKYGPERYIEATVWSDEGLKDFLQT